MPPPKPARAMLWRGKWYFFFADSSGRQKRLLCENQGCFTADQREEYVDQLRERERHDAAQRLRLGPALDYGHSLRAAVGEYLEYSDGRRELAEASKQEVHKALDPFLAWLAKTQPRLTTGGLGGQVIAAYLRTLTTRPATVNKCRRNLKQMLRWLDAVRPRMFPEIAHLMPALKQEHVEPRDEMALTPAEIRVAVKRLPAEQQRIFRFLALTGCRAGEAFALSWDDVDLARGRITFRASKTKRTRILPLRGAPEGDVAPRLLAELKRWKKRGRPPCGGSYDLERWRGQVTPQRLRRNFTSYAASVGIPPAVCALWQGHSLAVAERYYRQQVLERHPGKSIEDAMGL